MIAASLAVGQERKKRLFRPSKLVNHNVFARAGRTSIRLESEVWQILRLEAESESKTVSEIVQDAERAYPQHQRTSAVRVWLVMRLFERAQTPEGDTR